MKELLVRVKGAPGRAKGQMDGEDSNGTIYLGNIGDAAARAEGAGIPLGQEVRRLAELMRPVLERLANLEEAAIDLQIRVGELEPDPK